MIFPDPPPVSTRPATIIPYSFVVPARYKQSGGLVPGLEWRCRVPVSGRTVCVLFRLPIA